MFVEGWAGSRMPANLAGLGRMDPKLLWPIEDRSGEAQVHLGLIRSRDAVDPDHDRPGQPCVRCGQVPETAARRHWGLEYVRPGGRTKKAKTMAAVAVARRLAILLRCLGITGEVYEPLRRANGSREPRNPSTFLVRVLPVIHLTKALLGLSSHRLQDIGGLERSAHPWENAQWMEGRGLLEPLVQAGHR